MRLLTLFACAPAEAPADSAPVESAAPAPDWVGDPGLAAAEVGAAAQAVLDAGLPDPQGLLDWMAWAFTQGDPGACPRLDGEYAMTSTFSGCRATTGWFYAGLTMHEKVDDGWELTGDGYALDPEGQPFTLAGYVRSYRDDAGWRARFGGVWGWAGADGWVAHAPDLALDLAGATDGTVTLEGGYGPDGAAVYFDGVSVGATVAGAVEVRDPGGGWYRLPLGADGCGAVDWYGEDLGVACVDLAPAVADVRARMELQ